MSEKLKFDTSTSPEENLEQKFNDIAEKLNGQFQLGEDDKILPEDIKDQYESFFEFQQPDGGNRATHYYGGMQREDIVKEIINEGAKLAVKELVKLRDDGDEEAQEKINKIVDQVGSNILSGVL